jgi:hypothetical protein
VLLHEAINNPNNNRRGRKIYLFFIGRSFIFYEY